VESFSCDLRNAYLSWSENAESTARRFLLDVPADQFATSRQRDIRDDRVVPERLWQAANGDARAQLEWFGTVIADLASERAARDLDRSKVGPWTEGQIRVFISHLSAHRDFAGAVSRALAQLSVDGFVAHDAIEVTKEWEAALRDALCTTHALVGLVLVHPGFGASAWAQQELGWALGRGVPVLMFRLGEDPNGFEGRIQAATVRSDDAGAVASSTVRWLASLPEFSASQ
jgi:hypothetical protein